MILTVQKYERLPDMDKFLSGANDTLEDVVYSFVFNFDEENNNSCDFIMFSFYYLLDRVEDKFYLTTEIQVPNKDTDECYFWNRGLKNKVTPKMQVFVDNTTPIAVNLVDVVAVDNSLDFDHIYDRVSELIVAQHDDFISMLDSKNVEIDKKEMNRFRKKMSDYLIESKDMMVQSLDGLVERYNIIAFKNSLELTLEENEQSFKKMKL